LAAQEKTFHTSLDTVPLSEIAFPLLSTRPAAVMSGARERSCARSVLSGGAHYRDAIHVGRRLLPLCWLLVVGDHTGVHTVGSRACECARAGAVAYGVVSTGRRGLALAYPYHAARRKPARGVAQGVSSFFLWTPPGTARAIGAREAGRGALGPTTGGCLVLRLPHFCGAWRGALGATVIRPGVSSE